MRSWLAGTPNRKLGPLLDELRDSGYEVLHDLHLRHGTVEHVVVGPGGVYVVEPRSWSGRIRLGRSGKLTRGGLSVERSKQQALDQAIAVRRQLAASGVDEPVTTVIAVTTGRLPAGTIDLRDLLVVEADALLTLIRRRTFRLDTPKVLAIADQLVHLTQRR